MEVAKDVHTKMLAKRTLNQETKNFISEKELSNMKNNVIIVNTARGGIIHEE